MFRALRRRAGPVRVFSVSLRIHQLDSIPVTNSLVFVRWELVRKDLSETPTDRTLPRPIEPGNIVRWNEDFPFDVRIPSDSVDTSVLQPCVLRLCIRSERRRKAGFDDHGVVEIDLAHIACDGKVTRSFLAQGSKLNSTLKLTIKVSQVVGNDIFRRPGAGSTSSQASIPPASIPAATPHPSASTVTNFATLNGPSSGLSPPSGSRMVDASSVAPSTGNVAQSTGRPFGVAPTGTSGGGNVRSEGILRQPPRRSSAIEPAQVQMDGHRLLHNGAPPPVAGMQNPILHTSCSVPIFTTGEDRHRVRSVENRILHGNEDGDAAYDGSNHVGNLLPVEASVPAAHTPPVSPSTTRVDSLLLGSSVVEPGATPTASHAVPLSPRSPSGSVSAAAVLEYLVPEAVQEPVYEDVRLRRVRNAVAPHLVSSRVPVSVVLDRVFEGLSKTRSSTIESGKPDVKALGAKHHSREADGAFNVAAIHVPMTKPLLGQAALSTSRSTPGMSLLQ